MDEKYEIACAEIEVIREETQRVRQESERTLEDLKALLEEADVSIAQTKKESYEFRRDVVAGGQNGQTGKTMAEKVLKSTRSSPVFSRRRKWARCSTPSTSTSSRSRTSDSWRKSKNATLSSSS
eukprot:TRINITY_DN310_c0_g1_i2.p2 TRINITY_DN310_c0_g1~~TRINITY_DN310_c0_g1_i2.p2  ORF type:complete len:124 (-),score=29.22 TRINITY_DN310_c0_g1_i2:673-1044(-)